MGNGCCRARMEWNEERLKRFNTLKRYPVNWLAAADYLIGRLVLRPVRRLLGALRTAGKGAEQSSDSSGAPSAPDEERRRGEILKRAAEIDWYHSIDLGCGVVTPGMFDHRPTLSKYPLPDRMEGMRVLEVATFDGFWSFEFERRGAAEVVAIDIGRGSEWDLSPAARSLLPARMLEQETGGGFRLARELLGSKVRREILSVYDLSPDDFGKFDMVFISDVLLHLMNPIKALQNVCTVVDGFALIVDPFNPLFPGTLARYKGCRGNTWWSLSRGALEQMIWDAGFSKVELCARFKTGKRGEMPWMWHGAFKAYP